MNSCLMFSIISISLLFRVSITVRMLQYISCPLLFRKPPDIFWRFFAFLRSLSLILSSNGTRKCIFFHRLTAQPQGRPLPLPQPLPCGAYSFLTATPTSSLTSCFLFPRCSFSGTGARVRCTPHARCQSGRGLSRGHGQGCPHIFSGRAPVPWWQWSSFPSLCKAPFFLC